MVPRKSSRSWQWQTLSWQLGFIMGAVNFLTHYNGSGERECQIFQTVCKFYNGMGFRIFLCLDFRPCNLLLSLHVCIILQL